MMTDEEYRLKWVKASREWVELYYASWEWMWSNTARMCNQLWKGLQK